MEIQDAIDRRIRLGLPDGFYRLRAIQEDENETLIQPGSTDADYCKEEMDAVEKALKRIHKPNSSDVKRIRSEMEYWSIFINAPWKYQRSFEQFQCALEGWRADLARLGKK